MSDQRSRSAASTTEVRIVVDFKTEIPHTIGVMIHSIPVEHNAPDLTKQNLTTLCKAAYVEFGADNIAIASDGTLKLVIAARTKMMLQQLKWFVKGFLVNFDSNFR